MRSVLRSELLPAGAADAEFFLDATIDGPIPYNNDRDHMGTATRTTPSVG